MPLPSFLKNRATIPVAAIGLTGVLLVLHAWHLPPFTSTVQVTDNAYVRGLVTTISPQVTGYITEIPVQDYMDVKAGTLLVQIDDRIYRQRLEQARASLATAQSNLANLDLTRETREASIEVAKAQLRGAEAVLAKAQADYQRIAPLVASNIQSRATLVSIEAALHQAQAGLAQAHAAVTVAEQNLAETLATRPALEAAVHNAEATVKLAEIDLQNTSIRAPEDGRLGEVGARLGQYVQAGTQLTTIVPPHRWVVANYKETQVAGMRPGQPVHFSVDALGGVELTGRIERFSPATGSEFSIIRADNATGNFTKVAQRLPVRITVDEGQPLAERLRPGLSVVVRVDTADQPVR
ncbi:HlyD family secretion protein [Roseomonas marmotae]|uniref:HlyD family secretion protein n=1 Tax=Roseomonas marmotae TaxID=2768161 RepID=A0ABS3KHW7_9PROT|nr:HlyD family secretion protein [Roseomonas marmotae]MBO1077068.1 HlyD family secretion protein [Roseomonas marmotae]QTI81880.1 HlyD family secretion protein [Roseomonas marmotae]